VTSSVKNSAVIKTPEILGEIGQISLKKSGKFDTGKQCQRQAWQGYDR